MTKAKFQLEKVSEAEQGQWLRSMTLEAKVEMDPSKLPDRAAARVYDQFVTYEDFARVVIKGLPEREVLGLVRKRLEAIHALQLLKKHGITFDDAAREAQYKRLRADFEANPQFKNIPFEDFVKQQSGMSMEAYKRGPVFTREAALSLLGQKLVSDDEAPKLYEQKKDQFGPLMDVRHIFLRADENPDNKEFVRTFPAARKFCEELMARIDKGEGFDVLVNTHSEDVNSKFKGGTLQIFTPASARQFPDIEVVLKTMKPGDVRGPVKSKRGYHIIKLESIEPAPALSDRIIQDLRKQAAVDAFLESFKAAKKGVDLRRFVNSAK
ncbi:MAG: peptidylprolyl isomerase [Planctomycetota bacterium]